MVFGDGKNRRGRGRLKPTRARKKQCLPPPQEENVLYESSSDDDHETTSHTRHAPRLRRVQTYNEDLLNTYIMCEQNNILFPPNRRKEIHLNMSIAYYFRFVLQSPLEDQWYGRDGCITQIVKVFCLPKTKVMRLKIRRIL